MCNHIVAIFTSLFAFICGNFVLLLAAWQHPSACARVSFGAVSAVPSLPLPLCPSMSPFCRRLAPFKHLPFRWLSNKAIPPYATHRSQIQRQLVLNVAYSLLATLFVCLRVCLCMCVCGCVGVALSMCVRTADSNYYPMSSDNWIQWNVSMEGLSVRSSIKGFACQCVSSTERVLALTTFVSVWACVCGFATICMFIKCFWVNWILSYSWIKADLFPLLWDCQGTGTWVHDFRNFRLVILIE